MLPQKIRLIFDFANKLWFLVKIVEIPNVAPEHAVRIFIEFSRMEEAMKAVIGLHNRFFSGRNLIAAFYDVKKYYDDNMTDTPN